MRKKALEQAFLFLSAYSGVNTDTIDEVETISYASPKVEIVVLFGEDGVRQIDEYKKDIYAHSIPYDCLDHVIVVILGSVVDARNRVWKLLETGVYPELELREVEPDSEGYYTRKSLEPVIVDKLTGEILVAFDNPIEYPLEHWVLKSKKLEYILATKTKKLFGIMIMGMRVAGTKDGTTGKGIKTWIYDYGGLKPGHEVKTKFKPLLSQSTEKRLGKTTSWFRKLLGR